MAFASKIGNLIKQAVKSNPSVYQTIRCMSSSKLFIGGVSYGTDDMSLREAFSHYGEVVEARIIVDRETGRSRGFGFVTFTSSEEASAAITGMDGKDLHGRIVRVNYANDRTRGGGGYGGGGYGGGGYGGGGYGGGGYGSGGYGGGSGNYGDSYGSGGGGYGGGNTGSYGGGSTGGGGYGGDNYGSGGGGGGGYGGGNYGIAGGGGNESPMGSATGDNFASSGNASGHGQSGAMGYGNSNDQYNSNLSNADGFDDDNQEELLENSLKDDDNEPDDFANRRS